MTNKAGNARYHPKEARLPWFNSCFPGLKFVQRSPGLVRCPGLEHCNISTVLTVSHALFETISNFRLLILFSLNKLSLHTSEFQEDFAFIDRL